MPPWFKNIYIIQANIIPVKSTFWRSIKITKDEFKKIFYSILDPPLFPPMYRMFKSAFDIHCNEKKKKNPTYLLDSLYTYYKASHWNRFETLCLQTCLGASLLILCLTSSPSPVTNYSIMQKVLLMFILVFQSTACLFTHWRILSNNLLWGVNKITPDTPCSKGVFSIILYICGEA